MHVLIPYASIEGQTRKIAGFAEAQLRNAGHSATLVDAGQRVRRFRFDGCDRVVLAASVHRQRHPIEFERFIAAHRVALEGIPTLLVSVSLCAAFENGLVEASSYVDDLVARTGFTPNRVALVAGALQFAKYRDYESQVVRFIALDLERYDSVGGDREFTDWEQLEETLTTFLAADPSE